MDRKVNPVTVRLTDQLQIELETLAKFDGLTLAEEIRAGIELLLEQREHDPEFRQRVVSSLERTKLLLERLDAADIVEALGNVEAPAEAKLALAGQSI
jgi:hypothetical protein